MFDFVRVSCCVPDVHVANTEKNTEEILKKLEEVKKNNASFALFPELCITGYTCGDLFFQNTLLSGVKSALTHITEYTKEMETVVMVGAPLVITGRLYNCAFVIAKGKIAGIVPKTFLPNYDAFSEKRWFSSSQDLLETEISSKYLFCDEKDYPIPVGCDLVFETENGIRFGAEICEDLWMPVPVSTMQTFCGAELIFNLSASNEAVGKRSYRKELVKQQSAKCSCVYAFASAGTGESTTDLVFSGHSMICENGVLSAENKQYLDNDYILSTDVDLGKIRADRLKSNSLQDAASFYLQKPLRVIPVAVTSASDGLMCQISKHPFLSKGSRKLANRCFHIFSMQIAALKKRLSVVGGKAVIGVSGGLDSTLALLVVTAAMQELDLPVTNVCAVTMPCFGTTDRTKNNAMSLMEALGVTVKNISVKAACEQHFKDIGHDIDTHDVTYENVQARERTQVLMDLSNEFGGIVIGTGDLSELTLGWCTYNGDHMSMYGVNAGIPKTLLRHMIESIAEHDLFPAATEILKDILDTPISPELLPPDEKGKIKQKTEDVVGPYELHDFFLYYVLRFGFSPEKIFVLACRAFVDTYEQETILKWLQTFYRRFFTQQFKRSCMPDGVKIGSVGLSPRGDWRMPSDAESVLWQKEAEALKINK